MVEGHGREAGTQHVTVGAKGQSPPNVTHFQGHWERASLGGKEPGSEEWRILVARDTTADGVPGLGVFPKAGPNPSSLAGFLSGMCCV